MSDLTQKVIDFIAKKKLSASADAGDAAEQMLAVFPELEDDYDFEDIEDTFVRCLKEHGQKKAALPSRQKVGVRGPSAPSNALSRDVPERISAPYRFVAIENKVVLGQKVDLNQPQEGSLSARIQVTWKAESPLLIGEKDPQTGVIKPFTLCHEKDYAIPGASLRGMLRSAMEIVAMARLTPINGHHRYGLRDFEHPEYADLSDQRDVYAGWLTCDGDPEDEKTEWKIDYGVQWNRVPVEDLCGGPRSVGDWVGSSLEQKYKTLEMHDEKGFDFEKTVEVSPSEKGIYRLRKGNASRPAVLVVSDKLPKMGKKKYDYAFHGEPAGSKVFSAENAEDWAAIEEFRRLNSKPSANRPVPDGTYKKLRETLKNERRVPIFYVGDPRQPQLVNNRFSFGFTRLFKIPHKNSVQDVLAIGHPQQVAKTNGGDYSPDFVENLFGYVIEPEDVGLAKDARYPTQKVARRGRIAFSAATLAGGEKPRLSEELTTVLMGPRPSFAPFYLSSTGELDYSPADKRPMLAGRKRYLPRFQPGEKNAFETVKKLAQRQLTNIQATMKGLDKKVSEEIKTRLHFLLPAQGKTDITFTSEIRLSNVSREELGGVLFALTHGGELVQHGQKETPFRHMIGHARPFGAGQLRVAKADLTVELNAEKGKVQKEHGEFLKAFQTYMKGQGVQSFPASPSVREFLGSCSPAETAKIGAEALNYMLLSDYQAVKKAYKRLSIEKKGYKHPAKVQPASGTASLESPILRLLPAPSFKG